MRFFVLLLFLPFGLACNGVCYDSNPSHGPDGKARYKCVSSSARIDYNQGCAGTWGVSTTGVGQGVWGWDASGSDATGSMNVYAYIGAYPNGIPPPSLSQIPGTINYLVLAFLKGSTSVGTKTSTKTGVFVDFNWDVSPASIQQNKAAFPLRKFLISVGGDNTLWEDPVDIQAWIDNAMSSLVPILNKYYASGIDFNYENANGGWSKFVQCIGGLAQRLQQQGFSSTIAPFSATWAYYKPIVLQYGTYISRILYQFYAEIGDNRVEAFSKWNSIVTQIPDASKLAFGLCANQQSPRGIQPFELSQAYPYFTSFKFNWMIWSIEDDAANNYKFTTAAACGCS